MKLSLFQKVGFLFIVISSGGCTAMAPLPQFEIKQSATHQESMGVSVQVDPLSGREIKKYFGLY